jgi:hypothetical protein
VANILRFILLGDDRMARSFDSASRSTDKLTRAVDRNNKELAKQKKAMREAGTGTAQLAGHITGAGDAFTICNRKASLFTKGLAGLNLATGLAEPLVSSLVVAVGGLSSALVAAGAGAGAYGLALKPLISQVGALNKAQEQAKGGTDAQRKAYQQLLKQTPPAIRQFAKASRDANKAYTDWANSMAKPVLAPLASGLKLVKPVLAAIKPLTLAAASAFRQLMDELSMKVQAGGLDRVVNVLLPHVKPVLVDLFHAAGNVAAGVWGIVKAFIPMSETVSGGVVDLTAKFKEWGTTLTGHSGFHAVIAQWRADWPAIKPVLENLLKIFKNIIGALASMTTPSNSKALWLLANPLIALAEKLSEHPALLTALAYLVLIGKGGRQIKGVFDSLKTGWGLLAGIISKLTGGKISLGMQTAGDTMLVASRQMQVAADTMAAASGLGKGGAAVAAGEGAAAKAAAKGGIIGWLTRSVGGKWILRAGVATLITEMLIKPIFQNVKLPNWLGGDGKRTLWDGPKSLSSWHELGKTINGLIGPTQKAGGAAKTWADNLVHAGHALGGAAGPAKVYSGTLNDLSKKQQAVERSGNPVTNVFNHQGVAAKAARSKLDDYTKSIYTNGLRSQQTRISRQNLVNDMINAGVKSKTARGDVNRYTDAIRRNGFGSQQARQARQNLIDDIVTAFKRSQQGKRDMSRYTDAIRINGQKSDVTRGARQQLINDLKSSGLTSKEARGLVNKLTDAILHIPTKHHTDVTATATARGKVIAAARAAGRSSTDILAFGSGRAAGWRVPGYGGGDRWPALLEGGETVVPKHLTPAVAPLMRANKVPGFARGGLITTLPGGSFPAATRNLPKVEPWVTAEAREFERTEMVAFMKAAIRRWRAMFATGGGAIVRDAMQWIGRIPYVWGGTRVPGGADCSGFVQTIYGRHGISAPRTSEAQGAWVQRSRPWPGGLAFYHSPPGGPDPGHVAIVRNAGQVISQGGGMGPVLMPLHGMPLLWTGVPPGGLGRARGGPGRGTTVGTMSDSAVRRLWINKGGPAYAAANMSRIANAESGRRPSARQTGQPPGLTGWGLYQITPTSGLHQNGMFGNLLNAGNNTRAAIYLFRRNGYRPWASDPVGASLVSGRRRAGGGPITEPVAGLGLRSGASYLLGEAGTEYVSSQADLKDVALLLHNVLRELRAIRQLAHAQPERTGRAVGASLNGASRRVALDRG